MRADQQALSVDLYKKFSEIYLKDYLVEATFIASGSGSVSVTKALVPKGYLRHGAIYAKSKSVDI